MQQAALAQEQQYVSRGVQLLLLMDEYRSAFELAKNDELACAELRQQLRELRPDLVEWQSNLQVSVEIDKLSALSVGLVLNEPQRQARDYDIECLEKALKYIDEASII